MEKSGGDEMGVHAAETGVSDWPMTFEIRSSLVISSSQLVVPEPLASCVTAQFARAKDRARIEDERLP